MAELAKTPEGRRRIQTAEERTTRSMAEHLEEKVAPPVHGGEVEDLAIGEPLRFEPFDPPVPLDPGAWGDRVRDLVADAGHTLVWWRRLAWCTSGRLCLSSIARCCAASSNAKPIPTQHARSDKNHFCASW